MKRLGPAGLGSGRLSQSTVWALSHSLSVGGEANQLLAQENVAVQHVGYRMCKERCQVRCLVVGISTLHISARILVPQAQSGFPKASSCCVFASGLDGSPGLWIAKIRSDAPIFVFNNRDKLCPSQCLQGSK